MGSVSSPEIFGDKQPPFISGYIWEEKQVSLDSENKTELCGKWKLLLDGAVFEKVKKSLPIKMIL